MWNELQCGSESEKKRLERGEDVIFAKVTSVSWCLLGYWPIQCCILWGMLCRRMVIERADERTA